MTSKTRRHTPGLERHHRSRIARAVAIFRRAYGRMANWPGPLQSHYRFARSFAGVPHTCCAYLDRFEGWAAQAERLEVKTKAA